MMRWKCFFAYVLLTVLALNLSMAQLTSTWERSAGKTSLPTWFSATGSTERGFAYGNVGVNDRIYVVSRNAGTFVRILNVATGADVDTLLVGGISGGTFAINDIEVSSDGIIFACNLTTGTGASPFKVYKWASETASPVNVISYATGTLRLGDKFTVVGSTADNSIAIYAAAATKDTIVKFTTTDNGATFTPTIIKLSDGVTGNTPSVAPLATGSAGFYLKSNGQSAKEYQSNGTYVATVPGTVLATGSNAIRYVAKGNSKFLLVFQYGGGNENMRIVDVSAGTANAVTYAITETLGKNSNANGTGDVAFKNNGDGTYDLLVLSTNNGIGSYRTSFPDMMTVRFRVNTATVPDTLRPISYVQVRGGSAPLTWGMSSPVKLTNIGGDYWEGSAKFVATLGSSIEYKFYTNRKPTLLADDEHQGWENDLTSGNRILVLNTLPLNKDTTLPVQYVNGSPSKQDQYWKPYVPSNDSIAVMFRVNMQSNEGFNVGTQVMGLRGSLAPLAWDRTIFLKQETQHGNGGSQQYNGTQFWSTVVKFSKNSVAGTVYYKFVIHAKVDANNPTSNPTWEDGILRTGPDIEPGGGSNPARIFEFRPTMPDTTLYWKFWANRYLAGFTGSDTVIVTFNANMLRAITENGFVLDDMLEVRSGYGGSAKEVRVKRMNPQGLTTTYRAVDTVITKLNTPLYYQYYRVSASGEMREAYYNFNYSGTDVSLGERRNATVTSKALTVNDISTNANDDRRMPRFRNLRAIARNVTVKFTVDARPAIFQVLKGDSLQDIQGTLTVKKADSVKKWGVAMNGPATGGWATWGPTLWQDTTRRMFDDGTHGDTKANDSIYTRLISYVAGGTSPVTVGQEFKFGIGGGDNEGGVGGFGNNHIENIDDSGPTATIASQWGSMNPKYYNAWDFNAGKRATAVEDNTIPYVFELQQNYPNPFNPSTTISYSIPQAGNVSLKIFNVLGQVVASLVDTKQDAGRYTITFDASKISSGIYFYQI
ncbi:MAG: T9SS type A sorting domain-containing protein, partial [bacterium]